MAHLKIINASRGPIHQYENLKRNLYNCNANIYFNQQCSQRKLIPNYAKIIIPNTSPAAKFTKWKTQNLRIKDEIKYLSASCVLTCFILYLYYIKHNRDGSLKD
jgi:hypothetical protein